MFSSSRNTGRLLDRTHNRLHVAAHTGAVTFKTAALPVNSAWSVDVGGTASYALIVGGKVYVTVAINGNSQLVALNGATGAMLWGPVALSGQVNAAYDRGRVFVVTGSPQGQIISALDATTGTATSWNPNGSDGEVDALTVSGSIVYAGGTFFTIGGQGRTQIAALDATTGAATAWAPSAAGFVDALAVSGSTVYVGGGFGFMGGQARNNIAAVDASTGSATAASRSSSTTRRPVSRPASK